MHQEKKLTMTESPRIAESLRQKVTQICRAQTCPVNTSSCSCVPTINTIFCENPLTDVPRFQFDDAYTHLFLIASNISAIMSDAFVNLTVLQLLDLSNNKITSLDVNAFRGLSNLRSLSLGANFLESLQGGIFDGLPNLGGIGLNGNQLQELPERIFDMNTNLLSLGLHNNELISLPGGLFENLKQLQEIFVNNNNLTSFPLTSLAKAVGTLDTLNLLNNPQLPCSLETDILSVIPNITTFNFPDPCLNTTAVTVPGKGFL